MKLPANIPTPEEYYKNIYKEPELEELDSETEDAITQIFELYYKRREEKENNKYRTTKE